MAAATNVRSGGLVTSTATEIQLNLVGILLSPVQEVVTEHVSGSVQLGVYENTTEFTDEIDANQATISTAGDKGYFTVQNGVFNLRCVGVGTFRVFF